MRLTLGNLASYLCQTGALASQPLDKSSEDSFYLKILPTQMLPLTPAPLVLLLSPYGEVP